MLYIFQKGFNYSQDGPGNRLVYHLQGCNLHCPWCSNPESMPLQGSFIVKNGIKSNTRTEVPVGDVYDEIIRSRSLFFDGGGVTFTGGEPTLQADALIELLTQLRNSGVNTAVESNASTGGLLKIAPLIDHLIIDVKHYDPDVYLRFTGGNLKIVHDNLSALLASGRRVHVRIPLIGSFNLPQDGEYIAARGFADFFRSAGFGNSPGNMTLEGLKYHEYGKDKWAQYGRSYDMDESARIPDERYKKFITLMRDEYGFEIKRT